MSCSFVVTGDCTWVYSRCELSLQWYKIWEIKFFKCGGYRIQICSLVPWYFLIPLTNFSYSKFWGAHLTPNATWSIKQKKRAYQIARVANFSAHTHPCRGSKNFSTIITTLATVVASCSTSYLTGSRTICVIYMVWYKFPLQYWYVYGQGMWLDRATLSKEANGAWEGIMISLHAVCSWWCYS